MADKKWLREGAPEIGTVCEVGGWLDRRHQQVANQRSEALERPRRNHGAPCKAQGALSAVKGDKTRAELAEPFRGPPPPSTAWQQPLLARAADVLGGAHPAADTPDLKTLHAQMGPLALAHDVGAGARTTAGLRSATS